MLNRFFACLLLLFFVSCNTYIIEDKCINVSTYLINSTENVTLEIYSFEIEGYNHNENLINSCIKYDDYLKFDDIKINCKDNIILYKIYSKVFIDNNLYYDGLIYIPVEIKNNKAILDLYYGCNWYYVINDLQYKLLPEISIKIKEDFNEIEYDIIIDL